MASAVIELNTPNSERHMRRCQGALLGCLHLFRGMERTTEDDAVKAAANAMVGAIETVLVETGAGQYVE